jgi:hypothetical protein
MWTCAIKGLRAAFPVKYCLELGAGITVKGEQTTYLDFTEVSQAVEAAELAGALYRAELPCWYEEGPVLGGSSSFAASNAVPTGISSSLSTAREAVGSESHDQV